ncbi:MULTISPECIES: polyphosphate kinase 2 [unclassified Lentimonas]|uniref:polyphosphate kinase 2 n=1 Tax=unclassified Lentimonas TaxID=2630993 RepID=UPI00132BA676|nr:MULTISPECIES: polyphosphate kinase 2 [unclassified Lentimonas]CAA6678796.1 UDP-galactose-lipid carrier transferase (EC [Lentimonas sp. CC4]CAA6684400.1 UDP-galactose-lipid carrier transferase (EC [Lentimonas sp. CC6]CAA6692893.1 UDP-galactose-lipid carrier transferase (EC [Lentimonas sp. CC19]CAA6695768.1 UDP-galactose-lipid carrier transferase (EC [Lentimonas sp. CC10]CAA7069599.1 UDP-galactose-lipid carrier transferase (EC [Lentimonas sp. CC11]
MPKKKKKPVSVSKTSTPEKLSNKFYEEEIERLQTELVHLQHWVVEQGLRIVVVFEGRDAAGKGGVIKRISERVSPRIFRTVALPAPSEREKTQLYFQRYIAHMPAAGEVVLFDRSWYNRAGVEKVMGFCTKKQHADFLKICPNFERWITDQGIVLVKYWLDVNNEEQEKRFLKRVHDPKRRWKLSPMDLESRGRWYDYSKARDEMLEATDTEWAPWNLVDSNDKKRARLNCISHLLDQIPYETMKEELIKLPKRSKKGAYDTAASVADRNWIPEKY